MTLSAAGYHGSFRVAISASTRPSDHTSEARDGPAPRKLSGAFQISVPTGLRTDEGRATSLPLPLSSLVVVDTEEDRDDDDDEVETDAPFVWRARCERTSANPKSQILGRISESSSTLSDFWSRQSKKPKNTNFKTYLT